MGKCSYRSEWLMKEDGQGWKVSEWAHKHSDTEVFCKICVKVINIAKKGFQALEQHASSNKHKKECHIKLEPKQLHLTALSSSSRPASTSTSHVAPMILHSTKDKAIAAEVIWILKCVSSNYAAASVDGIHNTFEAMFPGAVPRRFSLSWTWLNYVLTEALEPYFRRTALFRFKLVPRLSKNKKQPGIICSAECFTHPLGGVISCEFILKGSKNGYINNK